MKNKEPLKAQFDFTISEAHVIDVGSDRGISQASLDALKPMIPEDLKLDMNKDLVGIALNLAVVNKFNKNHDGIDTKGALALLDSFANKPINIEHEKWMVIGHIVDAKFTDISTNEPMEKMPSKGSKEQFYISISAVLYKVADPYFVDYVVNNAGNGSVSGSWEVTYSEYSIAKGPKELKGCTVYTDDETVSSLSEKLKTFGGEGVDEDGMSVYTLIGSDAHAVGAALTSNPAADVRGVVVHSEDSKHGKKNMSQVSHKHKNNVKSVKQPSIEMDELIKELTKVLKENNASQESVASLTSTLADAIKSKDGEWQQQIANEKKAKQDAEQKRKELDESLAKMKTELEETKKSLEEIEKEKKVAEASARFDSRLREVTEAYELSDDEKNIVVEDIKALDETEESFASYKNKLAVLFAGKTKEAVAQQKEDLEKSIRKELKEKLTKAASNKIQDLEKALASLEEEKGGLPNGGDGEEEDFMTKAKRVLSETVTVK